MLRRGTAAFNIPFDGGAKPFEPERPTAGDPPAPETDGTKAVTAEDSGITVDPLENFVTPAGVELTVTGAAVRECAVAEDTFIRKTRADFAPRFVELADG